MPSTLRSKLEDFIQKYAWHTRDCASIDADGKWHKGNPECDCGYLKEVTHIAFLISIIGERNRD